MRWFIYRLRCIVPGVGDYVGRTTRPFAREREHRKQCASGVKLDAAVTLYGAEKFIYEILEEFDCKSVKEASDVEAGWILRLGTTWPHGLNAPHSKPPRQLPNQSKRRKRVSGYSVYRITQRETGMVYIGMSNQGYGRFVQHAHTRCNSKIGQAIRLFGRDAFTLAIIETFALKSDASAKESELILQLGTIWPNGFNLTKGGKGSVIKNLSSEARKKRSDSQRGRVATPEQRQKIRESWQRNRDERVAAIAAANRRVAEDRAARGESHPSKGKVSPFKGSRRAPYGQSRIHKDTNEKRGKSLREFYDDNPDKRAEVGAASKARWADPEFRARRAVAIAESLKKRRAQRELMLSPEGSA